LAIIFLNGRLHKKDLVAYLVNLSSDSCSRHYMGRAYSSLSMFMVYANGLKSVVTISGEAMPLAAIEYLSFSVTG